MEDRVGRDGKEDGISERARKEGKQNAANLTGAPVPASFSSLYFNCDSHLLIGKKQKGRRTQKRTR